MTNLGSVQNSNSFTWPKRTATGVETNRSNTRTETNQHLAEDLNEFYCRFEKQKPGFKAHTRSDRLTAQPSTPHYCFSVLNLQWGRVQSLQEAEEKESQRSIRCLSSLPQSLCGPAITHLHTDLQQIWRCVKSPPASNAPPSSLYQWIKKSQDSMLL